MEARLVHVRKDAATQGEQSQYYISKANQAGVPVRHDLYKELPGHCLNISEEAMHFLHDILGPKGAWNGWHLQAIGEVKKGANGTYFDMVLARKSVAKPFLTPGTDSFEMVSSPDKTFSSPDKTFSSLDKMVSSPDKTFSSLDKMVSSPDKTFSSLDKMVSSPDKTFSSLDKMVSSPEKMIPSPEKKVSLPQSSSHCLRSMSPVNLASLGDGPYRCVVVRMPEMDQFEMISSPEKTASSSTEEMVSSPEKVVSAPEKATSAPEKRTWW